MISCDEGYNTSSIGLSCDNGVLSGVAGCFYDPGPRTGWVEIGHWVIYDIEDTQVYDPFLGDKYKNAAGINVTLKTKYSSLAENPLYPTRAAFDRLFKLEVADLLRISLSRIHVFRVWDAANVEVNGLTQALIYRTTIEFIVLDCDDPEQKPVTLENGEISSITLDCADDGELDPTQAVDQFIEYYYVEDSVLYKYSNKLSILGLVDSDFGIEVIATCGQDPCMPKMEGFLPWIVSACFIFAWALMACIIMTHGRGALGWLLK